MRKQLSTWLIAATLGLGLAWWGPSFFILPKNIPIDVPSVLASFIKAICNVVGFHILISGRFLRKYAYSIPFLGIHIIMLLFQILHWTGADMMKTAVVIVSVTSYGIYFYNKPSRSNIDLFLLFYIMILQITQWNEIFGYWGEKMVAAGILTASLQLLPICILHLRNEYLKFQVS